MRKLRILFCCLLGLLSDAHAQQPTAVPSNPKALMLAAAKLNNLATDDAKPWHIKATFQLFDEHGAVADEGTYEEFWASSTKFKRILTGKAFVENYYGGLKGPLRSGNGLPPVFLIDARVHLVAPIPNYRNLMPGDIYSKPLEMSGMKLNCVTARFTNSPTHCLSLEEPVLRVSSDPLDSFQVLHNRILRFQDRMIAGDLTLVSKGKKLLTMHVDSLTTLDTTDKAVFTPPPDAVPVPRRIQISGGVAQGMRKSSVPPVYPIEAKNAHITGTVVLQAVIGTDGRVKDVTALSGPAELQQAAIDSLRQWRYAPYLLNGDAVEVYTTVNIIFSLDK